MFRDLAFLRGQIHKYDLQRIEEEITALAKPSVQLIRSGIDESVLPLGTSKLGGHPDLPNGYSWPHRGEKPLKFIAQFRFSELSHYDKTGLLPANGLLYYFYDADETPWGFHGDTDGWHMIYIEDEGTDLIRYDHPTAKGKWIQIQALQSHSLLFQACLSLPRIFLVESDQYNIEFDKDTNEHDKYWQMCDDNYLPPRHHFFGHPIRWQGQIEEEIATHSKNIVRQQNPLSGRYEFTPEQEQVIADESDHWQFLFQIDEDESLNLTLEAGGSIYIGIQKKRLINRDFSRCWTILQRS